MTGSADIGSNEPVVTVKKIKRKLNVIRRIKEAKRKLNGKI